ncbi:MAG: hypothetical protein PHY93_15300 [Bacteriovorax sp.]|nr:hypothetical protein [Bacteriovorax sp.]
MKTTIVLLSLILAGSVYAKGNMVQGGSNIGGGNNGSEYMATWCKGQSSLLRNYRDRAQLKVNNTGDYNLANKILNDGMIQALKSLKTENESFLIKSLVRGLEIARNLDADSAKNTVRKAMTTNHILANYYNFMLETVAKNLDLGAYIPYIQSSNDQMDENAAHFEENFVVYASSQLDWITENLTRESRLGDKIIVVPVGDAKALIKVAIILTKGTADDLDESLWNYRFSCAISDLQVLNETITSYDQGNREMFDDEKVAVGYLASEIKRISRTLRLKTSCN